MAKGENIFKRRDGRWEARYIKGRELSGKIRYGFCYGRTYKEAKEKVTQRKAAVLNGSPAPETGSRHRLAFYCDRWLELRRPKVKEATYIKYSTALEKHIKPRLGGCFPLGITGGLTGAFARELLEAGLSPKTVRDILAVLHGVLKYTAAQFPGIFPAVEIPYPKCGRKEMRVLSREEQQRLADYLLADLDPCRFGVLLWKASWDFVLAEPEDCIFYIRYYYSAGCRAYAYEAHLQCYQPIIERVRPAFRDGTNLDMLIHQIFSTMLFFASRVLSGELENNEKTAGWVFEQIYSFVVPNVRRELLEVEPS